MREIKFKISRLYNRLVLNLIIMLSKIVWDITHNNEQSLIDIRVPTRFAKNILGYWK